MRSLWVAALSIVSAPLRFLALRGVAFGCLLVVYWLLMSVVDGLVAGTSSGTAAQSPKRKTQKIRMIKSRRVIGGDIDDYLERELHSQQLEDPITDEQFADIINLAIGNKLIENQTIDGKVVRLDGDDVYVDVGLKSETRIPIKDFKLDPEFVDVSVGEDVPVFLEKVEGREGNVVLSREKAVRIDLWNKLERKAEAGEEVTGTITDLGRWGYLVNIHGVVAFLPASHADVRQIKNPESMLGTVHNFVILKMDKSQDNVVVSRRLVLESQNVDARDKFLNELKEGDIIEGRVKSITNYGVFVGIHESSELGVIDGLLHITDISWNRISHPSAIFSLGQTIRAMVTCVNKETRRVSLGTKQLDGNPWSDIEERFKVDGIYTGVVNSIENYGIFVELSPGIEGLVHISEMSWVKTSTPIDKMVSLGQEIQVKVLSVDKAKYRMSLSVKRCKSNPWKVFLERYPQGSVISGTVKNIVDFGLFVGFNDPEISSGIDGLVHISDLDWDNNPEEEIKNYSVGMKIKAKILRVNTVRYRINLGVKQVEYDPFDAFLRKTNLGDRFERPVVKIEDCGVLVEIIEGTVVLVEHEYLPTDKKLSIGDMLSLVVLAIEKYGILLSAI